jgi:DNA-binding XRE family transcriptional regulator
MMGPAMRRKLRAAELAKFRAKVERDPGAHPLRVARVRANLTVAELAQLADLSAGTLGGIERGYSPGTRSTQRRLGRVLGVPTSEIFGDPR